MADLLPISSLALPTQQDFTQMLQNENISEAHIPTHLFSVVRLNAKQIRASRGCVVVLLHNGEVLTWGRNAQPVLVRHLHNIESLSTSKDGQFVARTRGGHFLTWGVNKLNRPPTQNRF